jgi:hypothetical protein
MRRRGPSSCLASHCSGEQERRSDSRGDAPEPLLRLTLPDWPRAERGSPCYKLAIFPLRISAACVPFSCDSSRGTRDYRDYTAIARADSDHLRLSAPARCTHARSISQPQLKAGQRMGFTELAKALLFHYLDRMGPGCYTAFARYVLIP